VFTALELFAAFVAPALVLGTIFALPGWMSSLGEARRRWRREHRRHGGHARLVAPSGPPLERLAADLRRLRRQRADQHRSRVQREGARLAYEDVLRDTARALGIHHQLPGSRAGRSGGLVHELELLRLEQAILDAGLVLSTG
jgi:hypothetical protein